MAQLKDTNVNGVLSVGECEDVETELSKLNKNLPELYKDGLDYCIRFPGTKIQICFGTVAVNVALNQNGSGYSGTVSLNHKFVKPFASLISSTVGNADQNWFWIVNKTISNDAISQVTLGYFASYPNTQFYVDYMAIGVYSE